MTALSEAQVTRFEDDGYLLVPGLLDPQRDLEPIIREYETVLDRLARALHAAGEIASTYEELDFDRRVTRIYRETGKVLHQHFDFCLPRAGIRHDTPMWLGPAVFGALTNPRLLDAVESIIGPEIYSNPVQHVRIKPPQRYVPEEVAGVGLIGQTPWHQDNGVLLPEADNSAIVTVWFPLTDAPIESGCLQVIPGSHRAGLVAHCPRPGTGELHIPERLIATARAVPLPMRRGDVLLLTSRTCHRSLANRSDRVRFSFDLRYQPPGQATGRPQFPGFVARSRAHPETELHDPAAWARLWTGTRARLADLGEDRPLNRWSADAAVCA